VPSGDSSAKESGVLNVVLETACLGAVAKLGSKNLDRSIDGQLVEEVKSLLQWFDDYRVYHVRRACNREAHLLAKDVR
jgi:hypothetical protein